VVAVTVVAEVAVDVETLVVGVVDTTAEVVVCVVVVDVVVVDLVPQDAKSNDVTKRKASEV
jgi:hypothetical protein